MNTFQPGQKIKVINPDQGSLDRGITVGDIGEIVNKDEMGIWRCRIYNKVNPVIRTDTFPLYEDEIFLLGEDSEH